MKRSLKASAVLVAAGALALGMTIVANNATAAGVTVVTTPSTAAAQGWFTETGASTPAFDTSSPTIDGLGQLRYDTPTATDKVQFLHSLGPTGVGWGSVQGLGYSVRGTGTGPEAAYDMEVLTTGTGGFTTLVWEPYQNGNPINGTGSWQTFSNLEGSGSVWWSSHIPNPNAGSQSSPQPLSFFQGLYPNAAIIDYGAAQGSSNAGSTTYVDDVSFNGVTTNFEPDVNSSCIASGVHIQAPKALFVGVANPATSPCATDSNTVASAKLTVIPGPLGLSLKAGVISNSTGYVSGGGIASAGASSTIASVTLTALGIKVVIKGLHAQSSATTVGCGTPAFTGSSYIASVSVNGVHKVVGSNSVTIPLGLNMFLLFNQHEVVGNTITQRAVLLTGAGGKYRTAIAEAISGVSC